MAADFLSENTIFLILLWMMAFMVTSSFVEFLAYITLSGFILYSSHQIILINLVMSLE